MFLWNPEPMWKAVSVAEAIVATTIHSPVSMFPVGDWWLVPSRVKVTRPSSVGEQALVSLLIKVTKLSSRGWRTQLAMREIVSLQVLTLFYFSEICLCGKQDRPKGSCGVGDEKLSSTPKTNHFCGKCFSSRSPKSKVTSFPGLNSILQLGIWWSIFTMSTIWKGLLRSETSQCQTNRFFSGWPMWKPSRVEVLANCVRRAWDRSQRGIQRDEQPSTGTDQCLLQWRRRWELCAKGGSGWSWTWLPR